jgi:uncharacterized protein
MVMPIRLACLCVLQLVLSTSAFAQNVNTFINIFQGVIQGAAIHEAQFQWRKLPPSEIACIDQALHLESATLDELINRGVMPSDPRLSQLRSNCHVQVGQQPGRQASGQPSSLWNHNGSIVSLEANGTSRKFRYEVPKQGLIAVGVRKGTLLFDGQSDGQRYAGTAFVFKQKCGSVPYHVSGPIFNDSRIVEMEGQAPSVDEMTCRVVGSVGDRLIFNYRDDLSVPQQPPATASVPNSPVVKNPSTPSFNCAKATYPDELTICANPELSQLDNVLAAGYEYVRNKDGDQYAKSINVPLFLGRRACGSDAACIKERQIAAIKTFESLGAPVTNLGGVASIQTTSNPDSFPGPPKGSLPNSTLAPAQMVETRIALVVGNSGYRNVPGLDNPANDARLMAVTLRSLGFKLIGGDAQINLDKAGLDQAVQSFGRGLRGADVGLFYYAGHGVQVHGANYLVPVDANPIREADVDFQMLDTNLVLRQMEGAGPKLNIVILDACRNNPLGGRGLRGTEGGLAQMRAPEGTLISFATQPGNVAQDGTGGHSPYTRALARVLREPGLGIFDAFNAVGLAVLRDTGGSQQPWVSSSPIAGSFYFAGTDAHPIVNDMRSGQ